MKNLKKNDNIVEIASAIQKVSVRQDIEKNELLLKIKEALKRGYNKEINPENTLITDYDEEKGTIALFEYLEVVDEIKNKYLEIDLATAQFFDSKIKVGDKLKKPVSLASYSYLAINQVSQTIKRFFNFSESQKIYDKFIDKKGTIISGSIENIDYRYFSVNIGDIFAFIPKEEQIPYEHLRIGNKIKFYVLDVFLNHPFGQVMGSRVAPEFLSKLFTLEVPEVGSGSILIKKIVRKPGIRAKMAVYSNDPSIDPIGSCIGRAGIRIKNIIKELNGEKVDVFLWSADPKQFLINACSPSKVVNIQFQQAKKIKIVVLETQYSVAVGQNNVALELLEKITESSIEIVTLEDEIKKIDKLELNGNLSYSDLEKLEIIPEILIKCWEKK